jgi:UTP--glucose-1-phosphate uridylyltransferase
LPVTKAVIPAAGLGTRFLPASKAIPKEMIPVVDRPGIQYAVEEAVRAGITDIIVVTSRGKASMEDHFDRAPQLEESLEARGKLTELEEVRRIADIAQVHYVRQQEPLGFGHAVGMAREHCANESFAVLVPDEIVPEPVGDETPLLEKMIEIHDRFSSSVIAVQEVDPAEISSYGVIDPELVEEDIHRIKDFVEKPPAAEAPSNLAARGRYVLRPALWDALDRTKPGVGNEIQLTDAINLLAHEETVHAYVNRGPMLDVGKKLDYLRATVQLAMRREDIAKPFGDWLREFVRTLP